MVCPFGISKNATAFEEVDPFNPENTVRGYINRRQGQLYGTLYITHVNEDPVPQVIYSAPKQHYPFDTNDNWKFPSYDSIELYEKLDGTCIIGYTYEDSKGNVYASYKTRLTPFLRSGRYGDFYSLWIEIMRMYPDINSAVLSYNYNLIFELYGYKNKILIDYDVPLDTKLIFAIEKKRDSILPPSKVKEFIDYDIPMLEYIDTIREFRPNLKENYEFFQNYLEENKIDVDEYTQTIKGWEGTVWYFIENGEAVQIKCKPPSILKYHWTPDCIPHSSIKTTIYNAFENWEEPTYDNILSLLEEEYDRDKIFKSKIRIENALRNILFEKKLQSEVLEKYKQLDVTLEEDKGAVMRYFGSEYPKSMATRIYNLLSRSV